MKIEVDSLFGKIEAIGDPNKSSKACPKGNKYKFEVKERQV